MNFKKLICFSLLYTGLSSFAGAKNDTDSLGLQGDNLDLQGVLELFKNSSSPEEFEKALNTESNEVNNLDLNNDNEIDYIRVVDHSQDDAHAFVLQVPVNGSEAQDLAVIEVEKNGNESADVQIVGDEDFYGKNYIIEAADGTAAAATPAKTTVIVNVWAWPVVRHIYAPTYVIWISPWHWMYYPAWWRPWKPVFWHVHHMRVIRYHHAYCHRVYVHRVVRAHAVYAPHRMVAKTVVAKRGGPVKAPATRVKTQKQAKGGQKAIRKSNPQKTAKQGNRAQKGGNASRAPKGGGGRKR